MAFGNDQAMTPAPQAPQGPLVPGTGPGFPGQPAQYGPPIGGNSLNPQPVPGMERPAPTSPTTGGGFPVNSFGGPPTGGLQPIPGFSGGPQVLPPQQGPLVPGTGPGFPGQPAQFGQVPQGPPMGQPQPAPGFSGQPSAGGPGQQPPQGMGGFPPEMQGMLQQFLQQMMGGGGGQQMQPQVQPMMQQPQMSNFGGGGPIGDGTGMQASNQSMGLQGMLGQLFGGV
jgi:hypothetical protein